MQLHSTSQQTKDDRRAVFLCDKQHVLLFDREGAVVVEKRRLKDFELVQRYPVNNRILDVVAAPIANCFAVQITDYIFVFSDASPHFTRTFVINGRNGSMAFSWDAADSNQLFLAVAAPWGGKVAICEIHSNRTNFIPVTLPHALAFSPDGKSLVVGQGGKLGIVSMGELRTTLSRPGIRGPAIRDFDPTSPAVEDSSHFRANSVTFSADSSRMLLRHDDGALTVWRMPEFTKIGYLPGVDLEARDATFLDGQGRFVSAACYPLEYAMLTIWDTKTGKQTRARIVNKPIACPIFAISRSGDHVFTGWSRRYDDAIGSSWQSLLTTVDYKFPDDDDFDPDVAFADIKSAAKTS